MTTIYIDENTPVIYETIKSGNAKLKAARVSDVSYLETYKIYIEVSGEQKNLGLASKNTDTDEEVDFSDIHMKHSEALRLFNGLSLALSKIDQDVNSGSMYAEAEIDQEKIELEMWKPE